MLPTRPASPPSARKKKNAHKQTKKASQGHPALDVAADDVQAELGSHSDSETVNQGQTFILPPSVTSIEALGEFSRRGTRRGSHLHT